MQGQGELRRLAAKSPSPWDKQKAMGKKIINKGGKKEGMEEAGGGAEPDFQAGGEAGGPRASPGSGDGAETLSHE